MTAPAAPSKELALAKDKITSLETEVSRLKQRNDQLRRAGRSTTRVVKEPTSFLPQIKTDNPEGKKLEREVVALKARLTKSEAERAELEADLREELNNRSQLNFLRAEIERLKQALANEQELRIIERGEAKSTIREKIEKMKVGAFSFFAPVLLFPKPSPGPYPHLLRILRTRARISIGCRQRSVNCR